MQVSVPEAARLLRVSEHTVRRRLKSGELQGHQVASSGGFLWMVEIPEELQADGPDSGEMAAMKALVAQLEETIAMLRERFAVQDAELEARRREVQELHVLLQQVQVALPPPRGRPWWKWWS
jgi:excisionase family DNA binding protein